MLLAWSSMFNRLLGFFFIEIMKVTSVVTIVYIQRVRVGKHI